MVGPGTILLLWERWPCFPLILRWLFPWPRVVSSYACDDWKSAKYSRGTPLKIFRVLFLQSSPIVSTLTCKLYPLWAIRLSVPSTQSENPPVPIRVPSACPAAWKLSQGSQLSIWLALVISGLSWITVLCRLIDSVLKTVASNILFGYFVSLRQESKFNPFTFSKYLNQI